MSAFRSRFHSACAGAVLAVALGGVVAATARASASPAPAAGAARSTLAVTYGEGQSTRVNIVGTAARPGVLGDAGVARKQGRTRVRLHVRELPHPQSFGSFYTTYVLWAIAPEGQAASLGELPHTKRFDVDVTTAFQTFGLIVTAEPHAAVARPSPLIVAENAAREDTVGQFHTGRLEYGGAVGTLYDAADAGPRDYATPLPVLGAHHAVDLAKDAGAQSYATEDLRQAEFKLATLDRAWPRSPRLSKDLEGVARDVMRLAEHARTTAEEAREKERIAAERRAAGARVARAESDAEQAREKAAESQTLAERQKREAAEAQADAERARREAAEAQTLAQAGQRQAAQAQADAEHAKAAEVRARVEQELARVQAETARREADQARRDREELQRQLFQSVSAILETRREARGLVVSLSDVLFDFDRATLTPGAREKLAKLAGVLLAYPGNFRMHIEGHTDSIGSPEYNLGLSVSRADSVRDYLLRQGVPAARISNAVGFGDGRPVAENTTSAGRQLNRRVEIVISDAA